ncbi:cytochrome P450 4c3-like isoform X1 [Zophobas morio]|uniref:cytochrome P450 4c3-like isoform X1 n=1 Tax=Zophobas morio TaxID=2755281 RepID=UPI003083172C
MFVLNVMLYLFFIVAVLFFLVKIKQLLQDRRELIKIPGPEAKNILGGSCAQLWTSLDVSFKTFREWAKLYYPIYNITFLHYVVPNILHPDDFELILSNPKHMEKSIVYDVLHNWLGTGLLTSRGEKWQTRRRILTPAFHFNILQQFLDVFNKQTDDLVKTFGNFGDQVYVCVDNHVAQFTLKTIAETAMGTKLKFFKQKEIEYRQATIDMGKIVAHRMLCPYFVKDFVNLFSSKYLKEKKAIKTLHDFTRNIIAERTQAIENFHYSPDNHEVYKGRKRLAMLDLLLTAKNEDRSIDDKGICEEVDTFMFEGHDTTAAALSFSLMLIACHKNVQDLIVAEIEAVTGDLHKKPTFNDLQQLKYLERVLKEVLRLYPSVPFISRKLGEELVTATGYKIPKDTIVHLHIYDLHHNPEFYPDPEKFDPDRFLPDNIKNRLPFAYVPFSAGPRNCIGQKFALLELKAALSGILSKYVLEPVDTPDTITLIVDVVLRSKDEIKVKFIPRF